MRSELPEELIKEFSKADEAFRKKWFQCLSKNLKKTGSNKNHL
jgi:hypothetical protein